MSPRPALLFHCQHFLGLGHLVRSVVLAGVLAERFRVVLLSGGPVPRGTRVPSGVELVELPPVVAGVGAGLASAEGRRTLERVLALRRQRILVAFDETRPAVVIVELFPFGRKKLAGELVPLLERARDAGAVTACSVRDILVGRGERQAEHDLRASRIANELLDLVVVHADPRLARLEDTFRPAEPLRVRVEHTGFVTTSGPPARAARPHGVVVSAGGGLVGGPLLRAAVQAQSLVELPMRVIAGPFLPEQEWRGLCAAADEAPQRGQTPLSGLRVRRSVPSLGAELATAEASVSQCGYNTALDVLRAGVPALVAPFAAPGEDEQIRRARRLEALGAVRVLDPEHLDGQALASEIRALRDFRPRRLDLDLDGARKTLGLLAELADGRPGVAPPPRRARRDAWLDPLRAALDGAAAPVRFFLRDDDAGWRDDRLAALLDLFAERAVPVDVGVIPRTLHTRLAHELLSRVDGGSAPVGLHQHGLAHANHERAGRKCEFGPSRSHEAQRRDIAEGAERLRELLGDAVQPIFTPPWNRCTRATGECLVELGFACLSRESGAASLGVAGLPELNVSVDWLKRRKGIRLGRAEIGALLAGCVASRGPVGVMFHHALMDEDERRAAALLLDLVAGHPHADCRPMSALVPQLALTP